MELEPHNLIHSLFQFSATRATLTRFVVMIGRTHNVQIKGEISSLPHRLNNFILSKEGITKRRGRVESIIKRGCWFARYGLMSTRLSTRDIAFNS